MPSCLRVFRCLHWISQTDSCKGCPSACKSRCCGHCLIPLSHLFGFRFSCHYIVYMYYTFCWLLVVFLYLSRTHVFFFVDFVLLPAASVRVLFKLVMFLHLNALGVSAHGLLLQCEQDLLYCSCWHLLTNFIDLC